MPRPTDEEYEPVIQAAVKMRENNDAASEAGKTRYEP